MVIRTKSFKDKNAFCCIQQKAFLGLYDFFTIRRPPKGNLLSHDQILSKLFFHLRHLLLWCKEFGDSSDTQIKNAQKRFCIN